MQAVSETTKTKTPTRTCVGCRAADEKDALLRVVVSDEAPFVAPDVRHRLGGRGVSVHPRRACLESAAKRGGFARGFHRNVVVDPAGLAALAVEQYRERATSLLLSAARIHALALGTEAVRDAIKAHAVRLLVVTLDAANRREEIEQATARLGRACVTFGTKESLGALFGRNELGVVAVLHAGIAAEVACALARVAELSEVE